MNKFKLLLGLLAVVMFFTACEKEKRNIAEIPETNLGEVVPTNINEKGFEFLENMQGHWIGINRVMSDDYDWFSFDYRAISPSQIHGIFEGGTMGNLLTSFFVTDFKHTRTIMARNGGLLNGIYRSSYFVLDSVRNSTDGDYYRLVDAEGGTNTMWMELRFVGDSLYFNAYTSGLGKIFPPIRHMTFKAHKQHIELAETAAQNVGFPENIVAWDFSDGFNPDHLNYEEGAKSATYLSYDETATKDVFTLAGESGDPFTIDQHPFLGYLQLVIERDSQIENKPLILNLSKDPLTDADGYFISDEAFNTVLLFSGLGPQVNDFLITYLHPGHYYVNIVADINEDGVISSGDITHPLQSILIDPEGQHQLTINNITTVN